MTKKDSSSSVDKTTAIDKASNDSSNISSGAGDAMARRAYDRGEAQKPTSEAYRNNWDTIFGDKKKKKPRKRKKS